MSNSLEVLLFSKDMVVYELYVVQRLLEELQLAQASADPIERFVHQQASQYYCDLLHLFDHDIANQPPSLNSSASR